MERSVWKAADKTDGIQNLWEYFFSHSHFSESVFAKIISDLPNL